MPWQYFRRVGSTMRISMAVRILLPGGFLNSLAEMTVRTVPANFLDGRLEAGLVCVISGLRIV
jgi:hypothetical protein